MVDSYLEITKIPGDLKNAESINSVAQSLIEEEDAEEFKGMLNSVSVFNQVKPEDMTEEQSKDPILGVICPYVTAREKLKSLTIAKIKFKDAWKYFLQFDRLAFKQGALHHYASVMM